MHPEYLVYTIQDKKLCVSVTNILMELPQSARVLSGEPHNSRRMNKCSDGWLSIDAIPLHKAAIANATDKDNLPLSHLAFPLEQFRGISEHSMNGTVSWHCRLVRISASFLPLPTRNWITTYSFIGTRSFVPFLLISCNAT